VINSMMKISYLLVFICNISNESIGDDELYV